MDLKDYDENGSRFERPSVRGIIFKDDKIALVHSKKYDYYKCPGGGCKKGENLVETLIREVQEETGLTVSNLQNCGYIQWYNPVKQSQYFVFLFKTSTFSGELKDSVEGKVKWMTLEEMLAGKLAPNMTKYLAVFQNETIQQAYGISGQGLSVLDNNGKVL